MNSENSVDKKSNSGSKEEETVTPSNEERTSGGENHANIARPPHGAPQDEGTREIQLPNGITILHDAENCPIPRDSWADGERLYYALLQSILNTYTREKYTQIDVREIIERTEVQWKLVLKDNQDNPWHCDKDVLRKLNNQPGVEHVMPTDKPDAVDNKIQNYLLQETDRIGTMPSAEQERHLVVLLAGDRDYSAYLRRLISHTKAQLVVIHRGNAPKSMLDNIRSNRGKESGIWKEIVESASQNPGWKWPSAEQIPGSASGESQSNISSKGFTIFVQPAQGFYISRKLIRSLIKELYKIDRRLVVTMGMNKDRLYVHPRQTGPNIKKALAKAKEDLENRIDSLFVKKLLLQVPRERVLDSKMLKLASSNNVGLWTPGRGRDSICNDQSGVRILVPLQWDKKKTLDMAQKLISVKSSESNDKSLDYVKVVNVIAPPESAYELMLRKGSPTIGWTVVVDYDSTKIDWDQVALTLINVQPQPVPDTEEPVQFTGDSIFAQRTSSITPVILVTESVRDEEKLHHVEKELHRVENKFRRLRCQRCETVEKKLYQCSHHEAHAHCSDCLMLSSFKCEFCQNLASRQDRNDQLESGASDAHEEKRSRGQAMASGYDDQPETDISDPQQRKERSEERIVNKVSGASASVGPHDRMGKQGYVNDRERAIQDAIRDVDSRALNLRCPNCSFRVERRSKCACCSNHFCPLCLNIRSSDLEAEGCAARCMKQRGVKLRYNSIDDLLSIKRQELVEECLKECSGDIRNEVARRAYDFCKDYGVELT